MPFSKLMIVDDNAVVRDALAIVLEPCQEFEITAMAKSIDEALSHAETSTPDLALVDLSLRGGDGLTLIGQLRQLHPHLKIVAYSLHDEAYYIEKARSAGADGYVIKSEPPKVLIETLRGIQQDIQRFPEPGGL